MEILLLIILLIVIGSKVVYKDNFAVLSGTIKNGNANINYPEGFNNSNCVVVSQMYKRKGLGNERGFASGTTLRISDGTLGSLPNTIELQPSSINVDIRIIYISSSNTVVSGDVDFDIDYKIVLMRI